MAKAKAKQRGLPPNAALDASKQKEFNQKIQAVQEKVLCLDDILFYGHILCINLVNMSWEITIMRFRGYNVTSPPRPVI